MIAHDGFYRDTLADLLSRGDLSRDSRILVVCGGTLDRDVLVDLGFTDVVISNLDTRTAPSAFAPFEWSLQDLEDLNFADNSFDFVIVHSGLHHCRSPHKGLLEMYRVASRGVIAFEPLENWTTRLGVRLGFGQEYEIAAVADNSYRFGGVRNTQVPNFVFRFTEREVLRTIKTYAPHVQTDFRFYYGLRMPWARFKQSRNRLRYMLALAAYPALKAMTTVFRRECNNFAFTVLKSPEHAALQPWLKMEENQVIFNQEWISTACGS
ncbi:class I SAM-dependent methyltransferase [Singulisphaera rosea]